MNKPVKGVAALSIVVPSDLAGFMEISQASREALRHHLDHFGHMLSEQGPMSVTFVHNNTLFGLQDKHFEEAIKEAESLMGGRGYLPNEDYRKHYANGRINDGDIADALSKRKELNLGQVLATVGKREITAGDVYRLNMLYGLEPASADLLRDMAGESGVTRSFDADLPDDVRKALIAAATAEAARLRKEIGVEATLSGLLDARLGLGLGARIAAEVAVGLAADPKERDATAALSAMAIPVDRQKSYLSLITAKVALARQGRPGVALWAEAEARVVADAMRRLFDAVGTFPALLAAVSASPQDWLARGQWSAVLGQLGLPDAFAPGTVAVSAGADLMADERRSLERVGGPTVPVDTATRSAIADFVTADLETISKTEKRGQRDIEQAHLCWTVLHDLGADRIGRRGYEALLSLVSLRGGEDTAAGSLASLLATRDPRALRLAEAAVQLDGDLNGLSSGESHADFLGRVTGDDLVQKVNDYMIGICAGFLDEGLAAWHMPSRAMGFFEAWRYLALQDRSFDFDGVPDWRAKVAGLPILPIDALIAQLGALGIAEENWADYCGRLLADLKGWAGMVFWRQTHPNYARQQAQPIDVVQYLAVRLCYQNLLVTGTCATTWKTSPAKAELAAHFEQNLDEYAVRRALFGGDLADGLAEEARALVAATAAGGRDLRQRWSTLADMAWFERGLNAAADKAAAQGWPLFRLAQHLGLDGAAIAGLNAAESAALLAALEGFPSKAHGPVWLLAFEKNYRDEILNAMALNRGRGRWLNRDRRPKSQVVFCIDEREESIHRHYEELDPEHETFGAAGFFGVAMNYSGLDDHSITPLCPAVVTPAHRIQEVARASDVDLVLPLHRERAKWMEVIHDAYWEMKRNPVSSYFLIDIAGFLSAIPLIGRVFFPLKYFGVMDGLKSMFVPKVKTQLAITRAADEASYMALPSGFTTPEQADRVEGLLRNIGLLANYAPFVVICAHGSTSLNNPHENAHDCGACGGKNGSPNSRAMAAFANRPEVRKILLERGIIIPDDTWFIGGVHNTASELVTLSDEVDVPTSMATAFAALKRDLHEAVRRSARERCRRFGSAPKDASLDVSLHHTMHRAADFSQVRPEWGHATNACAVVGRRALTQGVFFDRRSFIISYDPTTDATGKVLERILMAVGPVGAGINLEYYFSTVDPKVYGSDTKVPHNVSGLVGVMEGAHSDLRTGLPRQMTEVHEAMRLHLIVDAPPAIAGEIYGRQPAIQQLLNNEWVLLIVHDPETNDFLRFVPGVGFEKWDDSKLQEIPEVSESYGWFKGKYERFLPPARIAEPKTSWTK